jgi:hypothetical protein
MSNDAGGHLFGSGTEAEVFEDGAMVVNLYRTTTPKRSAFQDAAILAQVEVFGSPAPSSR